MESYNTYSDLYNEKYGIMSEHLFDQTIIFHPVSEEQSLLYHKSCSANLDSYYFSAFTGSVVMICLPFLTIGYGLCYFFFSNTTLIHQIFFYLYGIYGLFICYFIGMSIHLHCKKNHLRKRVMNEIPNEMKKNK
jgi:hypothetical protein